MGRHAAALHAGSGELGQPLGAPDHELACALNDTLRSRQGNVVIPAFAVGRTQEVIHLIAELCSQGRVPAHELYVDSPMALAATRIHFTEDVADSMKINAVRAGAVILSASGMCEGGRLPGGGHAQPALLSWLGHFGSARASTWVVHGEPLAAHALREAIEERLGWTARVAELQAVTI